ncbi:MAG: hypothetical protein IVW57_17540, partial [Ktedonobacterales bacterium]|nr:hypothetical protein [Ktedonobacterales bacterium]
LSFDPLMLVIVIGSVALALGRNHRRRRRRAAHAGAHPLAHPLRRIPPFVPHVPWRREPVAG